MWNFIKNWIIPIAIGVGIVFAVRAFVIQWYTVEGPSMAPNLQDKEFIFVSKLSPINRGDVVVFEAKNVDPQNQVGHDIYVKRVIGVAGDTVEHKGSDIYVNGKKINQDYINSEQRTSGTWRDWTLADLSKRVTWKDSDRDKTTVPKDSYFVLGDGRAVSNDSRTFGFVPKQYVLGKVIVPFWADSNEAHRKAVNDNSSDFFAK